MLRLEPSNDVGVLAFTGEVLEASKLRFVLTLRVVDEDYKWSRNRRKKTSKRYVAYILPLFVV